MTHPLTPREKDVQERVEKIVFEKFYGGPLSGATGRLATALIAEFNLTALASGSGDHAELADRLLNVSLRWDDADQEREEASRAITSLIAEIAALRAQVMISDMDAGDITASNADLSSRLTEAERKLAEAVSVLHEIAKGEAPPEKHGHYLAHREAVKAARTFLSKEAERG